MGAGQRAGVRDRVSGFREQRAEGRDETVIYNRLRQACNNKVNALAIISGEYLPILEMDEREQGHNNGSSKLVRYCLFLVR